MSPPLMMLRSLDARRLAAQLGGKAHACYENAHDVDKLIFVGVVNSDEDASAWVEGHEPTWVWRP